MRNQRSAVAWLSWSSSSAILMTYHLSPSQSVFWTRKFLGSPPTIMGLKRQDNNIISLWDTLTLLTCSNYKKSRVTKSKVGSTMHSLKTVNFKPNSSCRRSISLIKVIRSTSWWRTQGWFFQSKWTLNRTNPMTSCILDVRISKIVTQPQDTFW